MMEGQDKEERQGVLQQIRALQKRPNLTATQQKKLQRLYARQYQLLNNATLAKPFHDVEQSLGRIQTRLSGLDPDRGGLLTTIREGMSIKKDLKDLSYMKSYMLPTYKRKYQAYQAQSTRKMDRLVGRLQQKIRQDQAAGKDLSQDIKAIQMLQTYWYTRKV
jgi:hypothetical protein